MNDSATGGFLSPADAVEPLDDAALEDFVQEVLAGISGLPWALVRAFPQPSVPKQPEPNVDWCGFTLGVSSADDSPALQHLPDGDGRDVYVRHESIDVMCQFYGPNAARQARLLRDGMFVPQNRERLRLKDFDFIGASAIHGTPDFVNQQWVRRFDITVQLRRRITRTYAVRNLLSVSNEVIAG